jgi:hypothetical protein
LTECNAAAAKAAGISCQDGSRKYVCIISIAFYQSHLNMGEMVLEFTGFSPFARTLQREIDIPLFCWGTLLDYPYSIVVHCNYYGHV